MGLSFPDVNVLLALTTTGHQHHAAAQKWYEDAGLPALAICRVTQISFMRILTTRAVMHDDCLTNEQAWSLYESLITVGQFYFLAEPEGLEPVFRSIGAVKASSPKLWADAYLSAFALAANLQLVTFDVALAARTLNSLLLSGANGR